MSIRIFTFLLGFGLTVIGCIYIIMYMNFMATGYTFNEYVNFIIRRFECYLAIIGFILITIVVFTGGKYEIHI